jgi:hypothetical protein
MALGNKKRGADAKALVSLLGGAGFAIGGSGAFTLFRGGLLSGLNLGEDVFAIRLLLGAGSREGSGRSDYTYDYERHDLFHTIS